ncbi:hypothetical protein FOWG_15787 [Fusarium oxysporum f. sp. lycopersici MN25]|nr:hypothetical protein FOWG_15787 [Fusarium oxysporum f. sp. lycopersici MN25]
MKRRRTNREPFDVRTFLASAIQARLSLYVQERLRKEPQEIRLKADRPLLDYALRPDSGAPQETSGLEQGPVAPILRVLLDLGAKPNLRGSGYKKDTPWELFLEFCYENRVRGKDFAFMENIGAAMEIMIAHGARVDGTFKLSERLACEFAEVIEHLSIPPHSVDRIRDIIQKRDGIRWFLWNIISLVQRWIETDGGAAKG